MLILTRKPGESIRIGDDIVIYVKSISGKTVRLGITAPSSIPVYREELLELEAAPRQDAPQPDISSGSFETKTGAGEPTSKALQVELLKEAE